MSTVQTRTTATSDASEIKEFNGLHAGRFFERIGNILLSPTADGSEDPLVEVVRRDAWAALRFLRTVMLFNSVCGVMVASFTAAYLSACWSSCAGCDRPLRWWLLTHTILQALQLPVRLVFWHRLDEVDGDEPVDAHQAESIVAEFTSTLAWKTSKQVSLATYGWFVLGVVWVLNAGACRACPSIYHVTVAVIVQAVLRAGAALLWFRCLFPPSSEAQFEVSVQEAATPEQISALPLLCFEHGLFEADANTSCAVCLSEYVQGEQLRVLPCKHHFHRHCADTWLSKSRRCPLCVRPIVDTAAHKKLE